MLAAHDAADGFDAIVIGDDDIGRVQRVFARVERQHLFALVARRTTPVLCIGETLEQREAGKTLEVVSRQLGSIIEELGVGAFASAVIAYNDEDEANDNVTKSNYENLCTLAKLLCNREY